MPPLPQLSVRALNWLPVVTADGLEHVSLDEAFTRAHEISHVEVRDPIVRAALNRFLVSAGVLVARAAGVTVKTAAERAARGFTAAEVCAAFDAVDGRLWLLHPTTPFMQSTAISDLVTSNGKEKAADKAVELFPRTPGAMGQSWFDVADSAHQQPSLTPETAVLALIASWFYSPKSNKHRVSVIDVPDEDGTMVEANLRWAALGTVGLAGHKSRGENNNLTFWHRGATLAEFLMLNTAPHWLTETSLPAWAADYSTGHQAASLGGHTFSANAVLLDYDETTGLFPTVLRCGHPDGLNVGAAKERANAQLKSAVDDDPTRVWRDVTFGKETVKQLFEGFALSHSTSQNLRAWFVDGARPNLTPGILKSSTGGLDILAIGTSSTMAMPQLKYSGWLTVEGPHLKAEAAAEQLIAELAHSTYAAPEQALGRAIAAVFPKTGTPPRRPAAYDGCLAHAIRSFHVDLEPAFGAAVDSILAGADTFTLIDDMHTAKLRAFDGALRPFLSARMLPDIARARAQLTTGFTSPAADAGDEEKNPVVGLVGRYARQVRTDTRFRVALSQGVSPKTEHAAAPCLTTVAHLLEAERTGITRALGLLAGNPSLNHHSRSLGAALAHLTAAGGERFDGLGGIAAKVAALTFLPLEQAVPVLSGLLTRLADANIGLNFHDVVDVLRRWSNPATRRQLAYTFHATFTPTQ
jgi:hypothetical protein